MVSTTERKSKQQKQKLRTHLQGNSNSWPYLLQKVRFYKSTALTIKLQEFKWYQKSPNNIYKATQYSSLQLVGSRFIVVLHTNNFLKIFFNSKFSQSMILILTSIIIYIFLILVAFD